MKGRVTGKPWTKQEDELLIRAVQQHGDEDNWKTIALFVPGRTNKACRKVSRALGVPYLSISILTQFCSNFFSAGCIPCRRISRSLPGLKMKTIYYCACMQCMALSGLQLHETYPEGPTMLARNVIERRWILPSGETNGPLKKTRNSSRYPPIEGSSGERLDEISIAVASHVVTGMSEWRSIFMGTQDISPSSDGECSTERKSKAVLATINPWCWILCSQKNLLKRMQMRKPHGNSRCLLLNHSSGRTHKNTPLSKNSRKRIRIHNSRPYLPLLTCHPTTPLLI